MTHLYIISWSPCWGTSDWWLGLRTCCPPCAIYSSISSSTWGIVAPIVIVFPMIPSYPSPYLNSTSFFIIAFFVIGLYNSYALDWSLYLRKMDFSLLSSNFLLKYLSTWEYATQPNTLKFVTLHLILFVHATSLIHNGYASCFCYTILLRCIHCCKLSFDAMLLAKNMKIIWIIFTSFLP